MIGQLFYRLSGVCLLFPDDQIEVMQVQQGSLRSDVALFSVRKPLHPLLQYGTRYLTFLIPFSSLA